MLRSHWKQTHTQKQKNRWMLDVHACLHVNPGK